MKIAIIPARGGSKRVPRKNIKDFCGTMKSLEGLELADRTWRADSWGGLRPIKQFRTNAG